MLASTVVVKSWVHLQNLRTWGLLNWDFTGFEIMGLKLSKNTYMQTAGLILSGYSLAPNICFGCYIIHFRSKSFQRADWRIAFSDPLCGGETKCGKWSRSTERIKCLPGSHIAVVQWPSQEQKTYSLAFISCSLYISINLCRSTGRIFTSLLRPDLFGICEIGNILS